MKPLAHALIALSLSAGVAAADARSDLEGSMSYYLTFATNKHLSRGDLQIAKPAVTCTEKVAAAQKAGVPSDAVLELQGTARELFPDAPPGARSFTVQVRAEDAPKICAAFAQAIELAALKTTVQSGYDAGDWMGYVKPEEVPTSSQVTKQPQGCLDAIDAAKAAGTDGTLKLKLTGGEATLDQARARCAEILVAAKAFQEAVNTRVAAEAAARLAKYAKHGIKGDRLELFAHYDMEWYLRGCRQSTGDPKKLKTAKVLFQWLTDGDGTITIRKFVFKGDKYRIIDRSYLTEGRAYAGCK